MSAAFDFVTLFRGISVPTNQSQSIVSELLNGKLRPQNRRMHYKFFRFSSDEIKLLSSRYRITIDDTRPKDRQEVDWIFACGDVIGAEFYAFRGCLNSNRMTPLIIELRIDPNTLIVDGRDSLYTIAPKIKFSNVRNSIEALYGTKCINHLELSCEDDLSHLFARTDIACQDIDVVKHHLNNKMYISGRCDTIFCSAFMFDPSEESIRVIKVWSPEQRHHWPRPHYSIRELYNTVE